MGKITYTRGQLIQNPKQRGEYYSKHTRDCLQKLMELSRMCDVKVSLTIFDDNKKNFVVYNSEEAFNPKTIAPMLVNGTDNVDKLYKMNLDIKTNDDYERIKAGRKWEKDQKEADGSSSKSKESKGCKASLKRAHHQVEEENDEEESHYDMKKDNDDFGLNNAPDRIKRGVQIDKLNRIKNLPKFDFFHSMKYQKTETQPLKASTPKMDQLKVDEAFINIIQPIPMSVKNAFQSKSSNILENDKLFEQDREVDQNFGNSYEYNEENIMDQDDDDAQSKDSYSNPLPLHFKLDSTGFETSSLQNNIIEGNAFFNLDLQNQHSLLSSLNLNDR